MTRQLTTREKVLCLVRANPEISIQDLCAAIETSNSSKVYYHLRRLEGDGLIQWLGTIDGTKKRATDDRNSRRWVQGDVPLPSMSKVKLQERIEMVVAKAQNNPRSVLSEDADLKVLASGIKVIIRKPALWGSKAHQPL